jgi:hypothetical protein
MLIYNVWESICKDISLNYNHIKANQILTCNSFTKWVVIKHDVETNVLKALKLAKIEKKYNIKATYYVQANLVKDNYQLLQEIQDMGHEVAYHYDVLDANSGNMKLSIKEFKSNIDLFHKYGFNIQTVCPHGNPVMIRDGWNSNKDFFRNLRVQELFPNILDIVVQLSSKLDCSYAYISDAGYGWKEIVNISDNDIKNNGDREIESFEKLLNTLEARDNIILSTHPHRWEKNSFKFIKKIYLFKFLRFVAKKCARIPILKNILSRYYYLAKKI